MLVAQRRSASSHHSTSVDAGAAREGELLLLDPAFGQGPASQVEQCRVGEGLTTDETMRDGRGRARDDGLPAVQDDAAGGKDGQNIRDVFGDMRTVVVGSGGGGRRGRRPGRTYGCLL